MTKATGALRQEHDQILKVLDAAENAANQLARGDTVPGETLDAILEFLLLFADRAHHGKEEKHLFPALERKGLPRFGGPIGVMLAEHNQGRAFIREMAAAAESIRTGSVPARKEWAEAASGYARLLREHIYKENNILFVMAERMLSPEEQEQLGAVFQNVQVQELGEGQYERLLQSASRLTGSAAAQA